MLLSLSVEHPSSATVIWPDSVDVRPFEVVGAQLLPGTQDGDAAVSTAAFSLTAFELGELEIPTVTVEVLYSDGARESLASDRFGVEVVSVGADEGGDIREIRGPFAIPIGALTVAAWLLLLIAALAAGAFGYRRWMRSRGDGTIEHGPPPSPAHEVALEALSALEQSPMLGRGQVKEYHIEASDILRRYVEARFRVPALEMTTWEVLDGLERVGVGADFRMGLRRFLDQCDLVKFAKDRPDEDRSRGAVTLARELVEATIPAFDPTSESGHHGEASSVEPAIDGERRQEPAGAATQGEGEA